MPVLLCICLFTEVSPQFVLRFSSILLRNLYYFNFTGENLKLEGNVPFQSVQCRTGRKPKCPALRSLFFPLVPCYMV